MKCNGLVVGLIVLSVVACTVRNKEYCGDGTCTDPSVRYCDVDGTMGGKPGTCIAVSCTPGEFVACRGEDVALSCAVTGNDYDVTSCPFGCAGDAGGCRQCTTNAQCADEQICDATTSSCRGCKIDDECSSKVCDAASGTCVGESAIVYAASDGQQGTCTRAQPCSLEMAIIVATNAPITPIVRLLPGTYTSSLVVDRATTKPVAVVGTGATIAVIGDVAAVVVDKGASVAIRNLASTSERHVQCGSESAAARSSLVLRDSALASVGNLSSGVETQQCTLVIERVDFKATAAPFTVRASSNISADRLYLHDLSGGNAQIVVAGANHKLEIMSSVLEAGLFYILPDASTARFSNVTFLLPNGNGGIGVCNGTTAPGLSFVFENSIVTSLGPFDTFTAPTATYCAFTKTLLSRQASPPPGAFVADPGFVDLVARDVHLLPTSPAVDVAVPATNNPDHDVDGAPRPQGPKPDLGAYERHP